MSLEINQWVQSVLGNIHPPFSASNSEELRHVSMELRGRAIKPEMVIKLLDIAKTTAPARENFNYENITTREKAIHIIGEHVKEIVQMDRTTLKALNRALAQIERNPESVGPIKEAVKSLRKLI